MRNLLPLVATLGALVACGSRSAGMDGGADDDGSPGDSALDSCVCDGPAGVDALIPSCPSGQWCLEATSIPGSTILQGVFALTENDVFAVGEGGIILHRANNVWTTMSSGVTTTLLAVWAASATDAIAVGAGGVILHYNGSTWSPITNTFTTSSIYGIWGSSATDVWMAAPTMVLHWNGTLSKTNVAGTLLSISGTGANDVWVTGESAGVRHNTGAGWTMVNPGNGNDYFAVLALSTTNVWVTDAFPSKEWMNYSPGPTWTPYATAAVVYQALYGASATDVWGVAMSKIGHWNGTAWTVSQPSIIPGSLWSVTGAGGHVWVVGDGATIAHRNP